MQPRSQDCLVGHLFPIFAFLAQAPSFLGSEALGRRLLWVTLLSLLMEEEGEALKTFSPLSVSSAFSLPALPFPPLSYSRVHRTLLLSLLFRAPSGVRRQSPALPPHICAHLPILNQYAFLGDQGESSFLPFKPLVYNIAVSN